MESLNVIVDEQLPLNQDFESLKAEGLAFIQQYSGQEWTNFNPGDPGVTILDELCYALTELGYCNDFSVCDILTNHRNELQIKDQFYLPQDILTVAPVTVNDYRKYIIDGINGIDNLVITIAENAVYKKCYQVYLVISPLITNSADINNICRAAFFYLNKSRNIGEIFLMPLPLPTVTSPASANIEIDDKAHLNAIWAEIQANIRSYIFPKIVQTGYDELVNDGHTINQIFNGPLLKNGWVEKGLLRKKRNQLLKTELINLIKAVKGVKSVTNVIYDDSQTTTEAQILTIILTPSWLAKGGAISQNVSLRPGQMTGKPLPSGSSIHFGAAVNIQTHLPKGKYRHINQYYSIQNTFPEIFAVGSDSITSNAPAFQIAQSRQLKGYLTIFDQVLANQFSQLANIDKLFSFKNATTAAPSDRYEFYARKEIFEKENTPYPVPYRVFAPTYFYQSLYEVPHIKPLLKDNDTFKFSSGLETDTELEVNSWAAYKHDPYNPYMLGLMGFMEDEQTNLLRRNDLLDHLLARHGESPYTMNILVDGSAYTGDSLKDKVVFKSLYLQNLDGLSYNRQKAYNFIGANNILPLPYDLNTRPSAQAFEAYTRDFIFNSEEIDEAEKLTPQHFINYSAAELKLSMLLGLKPLYQSVITNNLAQGNVKDLLLAKWLIEQRRGLIFIETCLLGLFYKAKIAFNDGKGTTWQYAITPNLSIAEIQVLERIFIGGTSGDLKNEMDNGSLSVYGVTYAVETISRPSASPAPDIQGAPQYFFSFEITDKAESTGPIFESDVLLIFPKFVDTPAFNQRLGFFLQNTMPVQVTYTCCFVPTDYLIDIVSAFVNWHNSMMYHTQTTGFDKAYMENRAVLTALITHIITNGL